MIVFILTQNNLDAQYQTITQVCQVSGRSCSTDADCICSEADAAADPALCQTPGANDGPCVSPDPEVPTITRRIQLDFQSTFPTINGGQFTEPLSGFNLCGPAIFNDGRYV